MGQTLSLSSSAAESTEDPNKLSKEIDRCLEEMSALREEMRLSDVAIAESRRQTEVHLKEISRAMAELRAA